MKSSSKKKVAISPERAKGGENTPPMIGVINPRPTWSLSVTNATLQATWRKIAPKTLIGRIRKGAGKTIRIGKIKKEKGRTPKEGTVRVGNR